MLSAGAGSHAFTHEVMSLCNHTPPRMHNLCGRYYNDLWELDLSDLKWRPVGAAPGTSPLWPSARSGCQLALHGDTLFVYGGYSKVGCLCMAATPRWAVCVWRPLQGGLFVYGGYSKVGCLCMAATPRWAVCVWRPLQGGLFVYGGYSKVGCLCMAASPRWAVCVWL